MLLKGFNFPEGRRPNLVVEVSRIAPVSLLKASTILQCPRYLVVISLVRRLCNARSPGYSNIYTKLLALQGYRLVIAEFPEFEDALFGDVVSRFESAIPIGVSWVEDDGRRAIILNPEADYDLASGDELVLLSKFAGDLTWQPRDSANLNLEPTGVRCVY